MTFYFDRNIGLRLARMIDAYDAANSVIHQDDDIRFTPTTDDISLIELLSADDPLPIWVTGDLGQKRRPLEREALRQSELTVIFLRAGWFQLPFHTQAVKLLTLWPKMVLEASRAREPTAFEISPTSMKVDRLRPTRNL